MAERRPSPYDLLDPRQRRAIALLTAAVPLPADIRAWAELVGAAGDVDPCLGLDDGCLGDRRGALVAARELIDEMLAEGA